MPYSEKLADRIRQALVEVPKVKEKKMFGGLAFMVNEKMCLTAGPARMMCRIDPAIHDDVLSKKDCRTVLMSGKEYKGYIHVDESNLKTKSEFNFWINLALDFNGKAKRSKKRS